MFIEADVIPYWLLQWMGCKAVNDCY